MNEIEGIDPLTTGKIMYPEPEKPLKLRTRLIEQQAVGMPTIAAAPASKVPNHSRAEQDRVAEGRVEKPVK